MNLQLDQIIYTKIDRILKTYGLSAEMIRMIQTSLNADSPTGELFKWVHLTRMSCECTGGNAEAALPGGIGMEFFALAADIFDDIQDKDHEDLPWRRIPEANAINLANCLLMLSFDAIAAIPNDKIYREICTVLQRMGVTASNGQFMEFLYTGSPQVSLEQYFDMVRQKSGSITACACKMGAILGEATEPLAGSMAEFGLNFGIMNQIRNDLNDFLHFEKKKDFVSNKKTLPYVYLSHTLKGEIAKQFKGLTQCNSGGSQAFGDKEKQQLKQIAVEEGVAQYCTVMFEIYRQKAQEILESIPVSGRQKEKMIQLVG
ncbi:MAG: polyprenyl synthetase [Dehalobacter sp. 4CP]|uniref:polyprenyl synthetase family protein n=1 Tax=Dehalobacter sp. CP TaxID=2594474 RepID=UPI0013C913CE|nr:polyprenyl synthetase [Dehalobacter sp. 4CP]